MMYPFQDSALIIDDSHLSLVSQAWIAAYPSHVPGGDRNRKVHFIDGLVLPVGGPGHQTYGHWIIDYLPRVAVARQLLGKEFASTKILLLQDTPNWAVAMLQEFCGIELHQLVWVHQFAEETILHTACIPTHCHSQGLLFHSYITELFRGAVPSRQGPASRRICVVRQKAGDGREFRQRAYFAELAMERGFELLDPGAISQKEQIAIFSQAAVIIGEYGSGMHNSVFAPPECQVVVVNVPGVEQTRLCAVFDQEIFLAQGTAEPGSPFWDLEPHLFHRAFDPANYERLERDDVT